jgi:hypothetical protein
MDRKYLSWLLKAYGTNRSLGIGPKHDRIWSVSSLTRKLAKPVNDLLLR